MERKWWIALFLLLLVIFVVVFLLVNNNISINGMTGHVSADSFNQPTNSDTSNEAYVHMLGTRVKVEG